MLIKRGVAIVMVTMGIFAVEVAMSLKVVASTPSLHSWVAGSKQPYSCAIVMDFGLMIVEIT